MNHKWKKIPDVFGFISHKCKVCGCQRDVRGRLTCYHRSGMLFGETRPDCIDMKVENKKTID